MTAKKPTPNKYKNTPVTTAQEKDIMSLKARMEVETKGPVTYLAAKHVYFDALEQKADAEKPSPRKERKCMTVGETKLGVTLVIKKEDCKKMGFKDDTPTKEVIKHIKKVLKLE